jgi:hypothetical protein
LTAAPQAWPPPDVEEALRAALGNTISPRVDQALLAMQLHTAQRECAALEAHLLAGLRANSLDAAMDHAGTAILTAEAARYALGAAITTLNELRVMALNVEGAVRSALAEAMTETGCTMFPLEHHNIEVGPAHLRVEVTDPAKLPRDYWHHPEPTPDKRALHDALRRGDVPGARLAPGPRSVRISQRK